MLRQMAAINRSRLLAAFFYDSVIYYGSRSPRQFLLTDGCMVCPKACEPNFYLGRSLACMENVQKLSTFLAKCIRLPEGVRLQVADTSTSEICCRLTGDKISILPHGDNARVNGAPSQKGCAKHDE